MNELSNLTSGVVKVIICSPLPETPDNFMIEVAENSKVIDLKLAIHQKHPLQPHPSSIKLIFSGKLLENNQEVNTIQNYAETSSLSTIHMVVNPPPTSTSHKVFSNTKSTLQNPAPRHNSTYTTSSNLSNTQVNPTQTSTPESANNSAYTTLDNPNNSQNTPESVSAFAAKALGPIFQYVYIDGQLYLARWPQASFSNYLYHPPSDNLRNLIRNHRSAAARDNNPYSPLNTRLNALNTDNIDLNRELGILEQLVQLNNINTGRQRRAANLQVFFNFFSRSTRTIRHYLSNLTLEMVFKFLWALARLALLYLFFLKRASLKVLITLISLFLTALILRTDYFNRILDRINQINVNMYNQIPDNQNEQHNLTQEQNLENMPEQQTPQTPDVGSSRVHTSMNNTETPSPNTIEDFVNTNEPAIINNDQPNLEIPLRNRIGALLLNFVFSLVPRPPAAARQQAQ
ncbi:hypothetical protein BB561_004774 [Smittium simulii]|uniref:Ubiquitin-like domain-containing protein n=1 Tax=Smittium simulii TaxID=133385 RepID=A0A2T9YED0_9FUNG|nr:hypothetical protein BB561_004774 [Smittium simulii]